MRTTSGSWHLMFAVSSVLVVSGLIVTSPASIRAASPAALIDACVLEIADVTGDGLTDFSVSVPAARNDAVLVYLIAGHDQPLPLPLDPAYIRKNLSGVLKGPAAMPFTCPTGAVGLVKRIGGPGQVRVHRPMANTLIDQPVPYAMVDLDPLMPGYADGFSSVAHGINAAGQIAGQFFAPAGDRAFLYSAGAVRSLGTLGGNSSDARGINASGRVVGVSPTGAVDDFGLVNGAFLFNGSLLQNLNLDWGAASSINSAGQIVGEMRFTRGMDPLHAFLYDQGVAIDLGSLPPLAGSAYSTANSINDAGQIVGQSNTYVLGLAFPTVRYPSVRAFTYANGAMRDLGSLGAFCDGTVVEFCFERSVATDINKTGTVVGFSSTSTSLRDHAFMSNARGLADLGTLEGSASWAYAVNDSGQVVGGFSGADDRYLAPFLYERGTMYDLNDLIVNPSTTMPFTAYDINNFGQIAGNHHLLKPLYQQVSPGHRLSFTAALKRTFGFAYWVSRGDIGACHAISSRLRLQVKFEDRDDEDDSGWLPADVVRECGESTDWQTVSVSIPRENRREKGVVRIRVVEAGPDTNAVVHLRHFSME